MTQYKFDPSTAPPTLLPAGLPMENLVDITRVGDPYRRFLDQITGKVHDGAEYRKLIESGMTRN